MNIIEKMIPCIVILIQHLNIFNPQDIGFRFHLSGLDVSALAEKSS